MPIRGNERSEVIELITEINQIVGGIDICIKRAGGENTLQSGSKSFFPDIILFGDRARSQVLQGWEAKMPEIPITDEALIDNATKKACAFGVNSFVLWNFTAARLYLKDSNGMFEIIERWDLPQIRTRQDVRTYETEWKALLNNIIIALNSFFSAGRLHASSIETVLTEGFAVSLLERNKTSVADVLRRESIANTVIASFIQEWWIRAHVEYFKDENDPYVAYAKSILLHWLNRVLFAHLIKRYFNPAREVEEIDTSVTPIAADAIFTRITSACDFYNIFNAWQYDTILSESAWGDILSINSFLKEAEISGISQESLQAVLEKTVNVAKRGLCGQFTTPPILADILVKITLRNLHGDFFDPCCGTGTIVKAAKDYKKEHIGESEAIRTVWAEDSDSFATQIAQLAVSDVSGINIPTRIFQKNVFDLDVGSSIDLVDPSNGNTRTLPIPLFEAIASNLPFIAFENIKSSEMTNINRIFEEVEGHGVRLDNRSDIYIPIIFALWKLLRENAYLGVITSNSWLATQSGKQFYGAVAHYYHFEQVHISGRGKWFENADVVATIILLKKKMTISPPAEDEETAFFLWNKKLVDFNESGIRQRLIASALQNRSIDTGIVDVRKYTSDEMSRLDQINITKNAFFHNVKWVLNISDKLCPITDIFSVFRGERRGWDKLFYPTPNHGVESQHIKPVLKSAKNITSLTAQADGEAFCCAKSLEQLNADGHIGALNWINRFSHECNKKGRSLPEILKRANAHWYEMSDINTADLVTTMNPETRFFYAALDRPTFINQRLIGLRYLSEDANKELCHALLNTMLGMFFIEACGFGRGLGVLDINKSSIESSYMLNPASLTAEVSQNIIAKFQALKEREIQKTEDELLLQDRIDFDHCVLQAYGIDEYYNEIKESLLSLQRTRLSVK